MKSTENSNEYLADTYALIEILGGNPNYKRYLACNLRTTAFHLAELYYYFLREFNEALADTSLTTCTPLSTGITQVTIKNGMLFKFRHKKEKLSYADCIGYALAEELGIKFLTGDSQFRRKTNVEFVT